MDSRMVPQVKPLNYWGQLTIGIGNGLWNSTIGVVEYVYRPSKIVETSQNLFFVATHPIQSTRAIGNAFYQQPVKEISELVTGMLVGHAVGKVVSYATKSMTVKRLTTVVEEYVTVVDEAVTTVVQKTVLSQEAADQMKKLSDLTFYFNNLEKNPALYLLEFMESQRAIERMKTLASLCGDVAKKHFKRFFYQMKKAGQVWFYRDKSELGNRLGNAASEVRQIESIYSPLIQAGGQTLIEETIVTLIPTEVIVTVSNEVIVNVPLFPQVPSNVVSGLLNTGFLVQNLSQVITDLSNRPLQKQPLQQQQLVQLPPIAQQPLQTQPLRSLNKKKFVHLQTVVEHYTLRAPRVKLGMHQGQLPAAFRKIEQILKSLQIGDIGFRQKIIKIIEISMSMGNQHPITMAARNCL